MSQVKVCTNEGCQEPAAYQSQLDAAMALCDVHTSNEIVRLMTLPKKEQPAPGSMLFKQIETA